MSLCVCVCVNVSVFTSRGGLAVLTNTVGCIETTPSAITLTGASGDSLKALFSISPPLLLTDTPPLRVCVCARSRSELHS